MTIYIKFFCYILINFFIDFTILKTIKTISNNRRTNTTIFRNYFLKLITCFNFKRYRFHLYLFTLFINIFIYFLYLFTQNVLKINNKVNKIIINVYKYL